MSDRAPLFPEISRGADDDPIHSEFSVFSDGGWKTTTFVGTLAEFEAASDEAIFGADS